MKRIYNLLKCLFISCLFISQANGQALPPLQPEQDACGALSLCGNIFYTPYSYSGTGNLLEYQQIGGNCFGETNSVWFKVKILTAGDIVFKIIPVDSFNDYDFAVWNMTGQNCANITNIPNIRCNGNTIIPPSVVPAGIVGLDYISTLQFVPGGTFSQPFCQFITASVGEEYLILVDNFSASAAGFTIDFTGSTAVFDQGQLPAFLSESHTCDNSKLSVTLTKPVKCSSIASDGTDFVVDGATVPISAVGLNCTPNGYTSKVDLVFASPLNGGAHIMRVQQGTDGNTLLDFCDNEMLTSEELNFSMPPPANPFIVQIDTPFCKSTSMKLDHKVLCSTIALDGSDFIITGPQALTIQSATPINCNADGVTDSIKIELSQPINVNGNYTLDFQKGTDNNFILDTCNFQLSGAITFQVNDKYGINATANPAVLCEPGYTQLNANAIVPFTELFWHPGYKVFDSTQTLTSAYVTETTQYYLTAIDAGQCTKRDTVEVILSVRNSDLWVDRDDWIQCAGDSIQLFASGGINYLWWPIDGLSCADCPAPMAAPLQTTLYHVQISDQYNCSDTLTQTIQIDPLPDVDAGKDQYIDYGASAQLIAKASSVVAYTWMPAETLNNPLIPDPLATPPITTTYIVYVVDTNRCANTDTVVVFVNEDEEVFIPSAFSPNNDGLNDLFRVKSKGIATIGAFQIYNRWGQMLYQQVGNNAAWDGTFKGQLQELGTYHYLISVSLPNGRNKHYKGDVQLVR